MIWIALLKQMTKLIGMTIYRMDFDLERVVEDDDDTSQWLDQTEKLKKKYKTHENGIYEYVNKLVRNHTIL